MIFDNFDIWSKFIFIHLLLRLSLFSFFLRFYSWRVLSRCLLSWGFLFGDFLLLTFFIFEINSEFNSTNVLRISQWLDPSENIFSDPKCGILISFPKGIIISLFIVQEEEWFIDKLDSFGCQFKLFSNLKVTSSINPIVFEWFITEGNLKFFQNFDFSFLMKSSCFNKSN